MYNTNCTYQNALYAWDKRTTCIPLVLASFASPGTCFAETSTPAWRLNQHNIAGSVAVVANLYCIPSPACLGCLTSFFFSCFLLSLFPSISPSYLRSSVHWNKVHKAVRHLTPFCVLISSLVLYRNLPRHWIETHVSIFALVQQSNTTAEKSRFSPTVILLSRNPQLEMKWALSRNAQQVQQGNSSTQQVLSQVSGNTSETDSDQVFHPPTQV